MYTSSIRRKLFIFRITHRATRHAGDSRANIKKPRLPAEKIYI